MNGENGITKIFIVAASAVARAGLETVLQYEANVVVMGSAAEMPLPAPPVFSGSPAAFDVLLINVERQKDFDALTGFLSEDVKDAATAISPFFVVALLALDFQNNRQTVQLLRGGARGILPTDATREEIAAAIAAAANNLIVVPPEMLEAFFSPGGSENYPLNDDDDFQTVEAVESLTSREREVLEMLAEGASNKSIAERMNISEHTVKFHVASVFGKLGASTRTEAVTVALRRGLILL